jgi:tetratricopeptide (TPR) repeat protein
LSDFAFDHRRATEISGPELTGGAAIAVAIIGSVLNALLAVAALFAARHVATPRTLNLLHELFWAHAVWAAAQLLPFLPFRAGLALARRISVRQRRIHAIGSALFAMNLAIWMLGLTRAPAVLVVLGCAAFGALKASREALVETLDRRAGVEARAAEARALLISGNSRRAAALARGALDVARSSVQRQALWATLAWAGIAERDPFLAHTALLNLPADAIDVHLLASYLNSCNRVDEALDLLREARRLGDRSVETSKLLIDLLFVRGDHAEARAIAQVDASAFSPEDRLAIDVALS